jgi:galactokinase/mevalonate kinase-like predicted kinase
LAISHYDGKYWPTKIRTLYDETVLSFIEQSLYLVPLGPRHSGYAVLSNTNITSEGAKTLSDATNDCWDAILAKDIKGFGRHFRASFEAQIAMFPNMVNKMVFDLINKYKDAALGWKLSGAGGGGYLILVADKPIENAIQIVVRRTMTL